MSEQPITREQAIAKLKKWRKQFDEGLPDCTEACDFLLREVEPVSYEELFHSVHNAANFIKRHADTAHFAIPEESKEWISPLVRAAAVLRVVETQVEAFLNRIGSPLQFDSRSSPEAATMALEANAAREILAALAQARRPTT